jgi:hypothetical protein
MASYTEKNAAAVDVLFPEILKRHEQEGEVDLPPGALPRSTLPMPL